MLKNRCLLNCAPPPATASNQQAKPELALPSTARSMMVGQFFYCRDRGAASDRVARTLPRDVGAASRVAGSFAPHRCGGRADGGAR